jgi:hypothetical protein
MLLFLLVSCSSKEDNSSMHKGFFTDGANELKESSAYSEIIDEDTVEFESIKKKQTYKDSIWKIVHAQEVIECENPVIEKLKLKKWSYCEKGNGLERYKVEYIKDNILCVESYLTKENQLIYAIEWEKRNADLSDDDATWWNCEYIIKEGYVIDHISLGMGKTEGNSFDIQDIVALWETRKPDFMKLKSVLY